MSAQETGAGIRLLVLDGLRGIAILMVLFPISRPTWRSGQVAVTRLLFFLADVSQMGWAGVELFFILSGYLILVDSVGRGHYQRNSRVWRSTRS